MTVVLELYVSSVCPVLENAVVVWARLGSMDSERLEKVQRSAAHITGIKTTDHISNDVLLARAGLYQLSRRCKATCG